MLKSTKGHKMPSKPGSNLITYSDGTNHQMAKGGKNINNKMPKTVTSGKSKK